MVVILQKMIMTGAMCVVAPGSSVQLLIAILVMLMYMLLGKFEEKLPVFVLVVFFCLNFVLLSFSFLHSIEDGSF